MAHPFKKVADDILEALLESGPRIGRSLRDRSDSQARKIRDDIDAIRAKDRDLAGRQRTPDSDVDRPQTSDADPDYSRPRTGPVEPLDVDTYAELRRRALRGDALEHDHIPSAASLIRAAERRLRRDLRPDEIRDLYNNAASIELPSSIHRATRTYGGRNTPTQISADARDLAAAANLDYSDRIALLLEDGVPLEDIERAIAELIRMNRERGIG
jgi:hypothetical protein